jgi:hypothetical protein
VNLILYSHLFHSCGSRETVPLIFRLWKPFENTRTYSLRNKCVRLQDFNGRLVTVVYYETQTFWMWRIYFMYAQIFWIGANVMGANISWARIFHGRQYFMGANISWAGIFHGREHFWLEANILFVNYYFRQAPIFNDFCRKFCPVLFSQQVLSVFAISFALIFCRKYLCIFSVSIYACCVRQYFWRKCFEA